MPKKMTKEQKERVIELAEHFADTHSGSSDLSARDMVGFLASVAEVLDCNSADLYQAYEEMKKRKWILGG